MKLKSTPANYNQNGEDALVKVYCLPLFKNGYRDRIKDTITVIFDVFRASTTIVLALYSGFKYVIPVKNEEDGLKIAKKIGAITAGEKGGRKIEEYHLSNSPYQVLKLGKIGKPLVLRSTNGTRIIKTLENNNIIVIGSTVNARVVAEYTYQLALATGKPIVLIAAGRLTGPIILNAVEDIIGVAVTAKYLENLGAKLDKSCKKIGFYYTLGKLVHKLFSHKKTLEVVKRVKSSYLKDIILTGLIDIVNVVPKLEQENGGKIVKIEI